MDKAKSQYTIYFYKGYYTTIQNFKCKVSLKRLHVPDKTCKPSTMKTADLFMMDSNIVHKNKLKLKQIFEAKLLEMRSIET